MRMTQQYIAGELSLLMAQLQAVATSQGSAGAAEHLRERAETLPVPALSHVVVRALGLTDAMCWESLTRGDNAAFERQAAVSAEIFTFAVCGGLIGEG